MTSSNYQPRRIFTLDEANRMLPLVRAITRDIVELATGLTERRERVAQLLAGRESNPQDPHLDELEIVRQQLDRDAERLRAYVRELAELGVELKGLDGLVDFPAYRNERLVYLCWKLDEPEILHWHDLEAGFAGRQRIRERRTTPLASQSSSN
jgi:hypothetical protein